MESPEITHIPSLQHSIEDAASVFATAAEKISASPPQKESFDELVSDILDHTNHMEAALASSGPFIASLERDVLPEIIENAQKLEDLFSALDVMHDEVLPQVELAISRMEETANRLNRERSSLEPSKLKNLISYFGTRKPASPEPRPVWKNPEVKF
jgi:hypothetical protein